MPTRLEVLLHRRKSAAAELFHRHITASASAGINPAVRRAANRLGRWGFVGIIQLKLYQIVDDFAWTNRDCQRTSGYFKAMGGRNRTRLCPIWAAIWQNL